MAISPRRHPVESPVAGDNQGLVVTRRYTAYAHAARLPHLQHPDVAGWAKGELLLRDDEELNKIAIAGTQQLETLPRNQGRGANKQHHQWARSIG